MERGGGGKEGEREEEKREGAREKEVCLQARFHLPRCHLQRKLRSEVKVSKAFTTWMPASSVPSWLNDMGKAGSSLWPFYHTNSGAMCLTFYF